MALKNSFIMMQISLKQLGSALERDMQSERKREWEVRGRLSATAEKERRACTLPSYQSKQQWKQFRVRILCNFQLCFLFPKNRTEQQKSRGSHWRSTRERRVRGEVKKTTIKREQKSVAMERHYFQFACKLPASLALLRTMHISRGPAEAAMFVYVQHSSETMCVCECAWCVCVCCT